MARLALSLLGPLGVRLDGEPITAFHSDKVRALLAYLATEAGRPHRRDSLAALLWPDYPDRSARIYLSNALSHLRITLGDRDAAAPCLLADREAVQLDPNADLWVDVAAFERLVAPGPAEPQLGPQTGRLADGVALYRGPFLEGFSLSDSPPFEQWALVTRERLQRQAVEALGRLGAHHERRGELEAALACARRQLALAPWQEGAHQAVMRLLAQSGRRADALAQYEACARALREELDVEPSEETVTLYQRIRDGTLQVPLAAPPLEPGTRPEGAAPSHNLPLQLTPFVGREGTLREIEARLADPACRLLTLVGLGGSGKTRLALEAAGRQTERFAHGVYMVSLAPLNSIESVVPAVAQAIGFQFQPGGDPRQQLLGYLQRKQMLLLLDNFEHLLPAAALVGEILQATPEVKVLATSRARLGLQGEQLFPVAGMSYPALTTRDRQAPARPPALTPWDRRAPARPPTLTPGPSPEGRVELGDALQYSAVKLFLSGAQRVRPDLELSSEDLAQVVRICHLVEGMPLAILLAAAWMEMLTPAEIAAEIERGLDFLASDLRDVPERQASVRIVFDHSWRLLTQREQEVLAALSVFRGGCTREAAQQVTGASLRELMALVDKSLLGRTPAGRVELHELLRQYAWEKLDQSPDGGQGARDRHAAYYAAAAVRWEKEVKDMHVQDLLTEINNARAACQWTIHGDNAIQMRTFLFSLLRVYEWLFADDGRALCQEAMSVLRAGEPAGDRGVALAIALMGHARFSYLTAWTKERELFQESQALLRRLGAQEELAWCNLWAAWAGLYSDDVESQLLEESVAIGVRVGRPELISQALIIQALEAMYRGAYEDAERYAQRALHVSREASDLQNVVWSLVYLGNAAYMSSDYARARQRYQEGLALAERIGSQLAVTAIPTDLGDVALALGEHQQAIHHYRETLARSAEAKSYQCAIQGPRAWWGLGDVALASGDEVSAKSYYRRALQWAIESKDVSLCAGALIGPSALLAQRGDTERAVEVLTLVLESDPYSITARSRAHRLLDALQSGLSPALFAAAQARGRARDVWATAEELAAELEEGSG